MKKEPSSHRGPIRRTLNSGTVYIKLNEQETAHVNALLAEGIYGSTPAAVIKGRFNQFLIERTGKAATRL